MCRAGWDPLDRRSDTHTQSAEIFVCNFNPVVTQDKVDLQIKQLLTNILLYSGFVLVQHAYFFSQMMCTQLHTHTHTHSHSHSHLHSHTHTHTHLHLHILAPFTPLLPCCEISIMHILYSLSCRVRRETQASLVHRDQREIKAPRVCLVYQEMRDQLETQ